jgi:hypothetical protein
LFNATIKNSDLFQLWHERYGHLNAKDLSILVKKNMVRNIDIQRLYDQIDCVICSKGKITTSPFEKSFSRSSEVLQLIHSDICGPMRTTSLGGHRYFALFIDDHSRKIFVYFLKEKSEVFSCFKKFKNLVENQHEKKIKTIRTDNPY